LVEQARRYFPGTISIVVHGSTARDEYTIYADREQDILLGNAGFLVITDSPGSDWLLG
jgi:hypothetical protein